MPSTKSAKPVFETPAEIEAFATSRALDLRRVKVVKYTNTSSLITTMDFEEFVKWGMLTKADNVRNVDGVWLADTELADLRIFIAFAVKIREHRGQTEPSFASLVTRLSNA